MSESAGDATGVTVKLPMLLSNEPSVGKAEMNVPISDVVKYAVECVRRSRDDHKAAKHAAKCHKGVVVCVFMLLLWFRYITCTDCCTSAAHAVQLKYKRMYRKYSNNGSYFATSGFI